MKQDQSEQGGARRTPITSGERWPLISPERPELSSRDGGSRFWAIWAVGACDDCNIESSAAETTKAPMPRRATTAAS